MPNGHLMDPEKRCQKNAFAGRLKALYGAQFGRILENGAKIVSRESKLKSLDNVLSDIQGEFWPHRELGHSRMNDKVLQSSEKDSALAPGARKAPIRKVIQDVLFEEGLRAVRLSENVKSLQELQQRLIAEFRQNSSETRIRYSQSVLKWFFRDGISGLARSVWLAYHDERIASDILRYLYLSAEPVMGVCVADALYPLQNGMQIPATYFERFLRGYFGERPPDKTNRRLKSNLKILGFLERIQGKTDRLQSVVFGKTSLLILLHHLFASDNTLCAYDGETLTSTKLL